MGGNIPSGNFLGGNFPDGTFPVGIFQGGVWWVGIFRVGILPRGIFLEPVKVTYVKIFIIWSFWQLRLPWYLLNKQKKCVSHSEVSKTLGICKKSHLQIKVLCYLTFLEKTKYVRIVLNHF